mgnify:FL=1
MNGNGAHAMATVGAVSTGASSVTETSPRLIYWPTQLEHGISILVAVVAGGDACFAPRHDADVEIDASRGRRSPHWALLPAHSLQYWAAAFSAHVAAGEARSRSRDAGAASCQQSGLRPELTANSTGAQKLTPRSAGLTLVAWCQSMSATAVLTGIRVPVFGRCIAGPHGAAMLAEHGADVIRIETRGEGSEDRVMIDPGCTAREIAEQRMKGVNQGGTHEAQG